jgi:ethanolamine transporter EutH
VNARATLVTVWIIAGAAAVGGSMLGVAAGERWLFAGAILGGALGAFAGVAVCVKLAWLSPHQRTAASVGAVAGFLVAAPIAALNLHTPVTPVLICSLAGVGALVGAGRARNR